MAEGTLEPNSVPRPAPLLDRTINLTTVSWTAIAWTIVFVAGAVLRLAQLGHHVLSAKEARLAGDAYRFFYGQTTGPGNAITNTGPTALLIEAVSFFLFGASDTVARIAPVLLGIGVIVLVFAMRRVVGETQALGIAALMALSPTIVYVSRLATAEIYVATFTMLTLVALLRVGQPLLTDDGRLFWAFTAGAGLAAMFGSGPSSLSVLLSVVAAATVAALLDNREENAFRRSVRGFTESSRAPAAFGIGLAAGLLAFFSRFFTEFGALAGIGETFADWGRLLSTASSPTPTQFFLLVVLLYEILAVVFAIVAASQTTRETEPPLTWTFFAIWFALALLIFSFSSGSTPEHAIHVALPLVMLGGYAFGELIERVNRDALLRGRRALLLLVFVGLLAAVFAQLVLLGRIDNAVDQSQAIFEAGATFLLALLPLGFAAYSLIRADRVEGQRGHAGAIILLAAALVLGAFTLRSTVLLSYFNTDGSAELLAQRTSTPAVRQIVERVGNLSRDTTLTDGSAQDPEGGHGLSIAIDRSVQWPYRWYFREFPNAVVVSEGQAPLAGAQIVITPTDTGLAEAGYAPRLYPTINRVPGTYLAPNFADIIRGLVLPSRWLDGFRFMLFRELTDPAEPENVTVGLTGELSNIITPNTGPFGLFERVGAGNGRGQFNQPRGIAVSADGERIFVVDMGNARVEHFTAQGEFIDLWGDEEDPDVTLARTDSGLGPTGIAVGPDGLIYVADTWNHRVIVLDESGRLIREFGSFADTLDSADSAPEPGSFFGPRDIAVANDEIYVVDTGNERVQVFALDGTFLRSWGGFGAEPSQFVEPVGVAVAEDGRIFVADSGNARISIFSSTGVPIDQWGVDAWLGNQYFEPYLVFDDAGNLYASSSGSGSVEVFDADGNPLPAIRDVDGELLEQPVGLAWSSQGVLLISDKGRNAVFQYFPPLTLEPDDGIGVIGDQPPATPEVVEPPYESTPAASPAAASPVSTVVTLIPISGSPEASPIGSPQPSPTPVGNG